MERLKVLIKKLALNNINKQEIDNWASYYLFPSSSDLAYSVSTWILPLYKKSLTLKISFDYRLTRCL